MMSQVQSLCCSANKVHNFGHSECGLGVTKLLKLETDQNKISPIKMAWKKMTNVKWGQARRRNFGHSEYPHKFYVTFLIPILVFAEI